MNEPTHGNNFDASLAMPVKRKRGRPRKDKGLDRVERYRPRKDKNLNCVVSPSVPQGFPHHVDQIDNATNGMVGRTVHGVVEAVFDAGYLLSVKIGNSNTILKGVVFKPGHCAPVTAENDVAPRVQMIRRNEILLPTQNQTRVCGSKGKSTHVVAAPFVPPVGVRGTVVPGTLGPFNIPSAVPPTNQVGAEDSSAVPEEEISDMNEPLFIEPLRTVHTNLHYQSPFVPNFVGSNSIGRMTELLQAVQENLNENQLRNEHVAACSKVEFQEQMIPRTGLGDEEIVQSQKQFQAPSS